MQSGRNSSQTESFWQMLILLPPVPQPHLWPTIHWTFLSAPYRTKAWSTNGVVVLDLRFSSVQAASTKSRVSFSKQKQHDANPRYSISYPSVFPGWVKEELFYRAMNRKNNFFKLLFSLFRPPAKWWQSLWTHKAFQHALDFTPCSIHCQFVVDSDKWVNRRIFAASRNLSVFIKFVATKAIQISATYDT